MLPVTDNKTEIDRSIHMIRIRMRHGMNLEQIRQDLGALIPDDQLFIYYMAAAIMERDYGRQDDLLKL